MLLAVCLVVPLYLAVRQCGGRSDFLYGPGRNQCRETFTITGSVVNRDGNLGQVELTMSYDTSA